MIETIDAADRFATDGPIRIEQFDRGVLDALWIALARNEGEDRERIDVSISLEDDEFSVCADEGELAHHDEDRIFDLINLASVRPMRADSIRSYRIDAGHASATLRAGALSTLDARASEAADRLHRLFWANRRYAAAKALAAALPSNVRAKGAATFARHMTDAVTAARMGFHFEEGGCWGMAMALRDHFASAGKDAQIRIGTLCGRDSHAYVQVGALSYDHSGEFTWNGTSQAVSESGLMRRARSAGVGHDDVDQDRQCAADVIMHAIQMASEESP